MPRVVAVGITTTIMDHIRMWHVVVGMSLRYLIFAVSAYIVFYVWRRKELYRFRIQRKFPNQESINTEVVYSISTIVIFAAVIYFTAFSPLRSYTKIYSDFHSRSVWYFVGSLLATIIIHDSYFYWIHRFMHWRPIFRYVHEVHHRSHNPTPLAAFSFHPIEAMIEIGVVPLIVFMLPVHNSVLMIFGIYMIVHNVIGHLGYELFPARFAKTSWFRLLNTSTHHNMHHHYGKGNYGLYFNVWDRLVGTNHLRYTQEFENVTKSDHNLRGDDVHGQKTAVQ